jgi:tetratricopeptide (TPR) repeat protein
MTAEVPAASLLDRIARGRLVGREEELAEATQLWLRALSGQAGLLLISGEPGIGKTRLAQAIIAQARIGGATVLRGGCYEFEATTPYLPLAEALRDWVHGRDGQTLRAQLGTTASELARLAPEIETRLGPLTPSPPLSPEEQRVRLFDNIAQFLEGLSGESGLLLFVDDLHWADQGTLTLLSYLMRRLRQARLLIVAAYREVELDRHHPLADALVQWNRQRLASRLQLARFTVTETNTLIATLFGQGQVSDEFAEAIHRETEGNPFFIEEVVKALVDQGQIYWADDHWERDELEDLAIPQSIREAIGRRLNHLSKSCIDVLHTAAVIGKDFPYVLLVSVSGVDEDQILDALDEAIQAQLIEPLANESFVYTHDKIREVLYDEILSIRRNRLHRQIVHALEGGQAGDPASQIEDLAYHTIAANMLDKGLGYALQAAEKAQNVFAGDEALQYFRQANECAESLGDTATQAKIHEAMGDIYSVKGPFTTAVEHYERAINLKMAKESQAALRVKIGLVYNTINDERGVAVLERAQEELDPEEQPLEVARALAALGRFKHYRAEYRAAISLFERAYQLAEPLDDPLTLTVIYTNLSGAYQHMAQYEESMEWAQSAITLGERLDYLPAVAVGYEFFGEDFANMGYWHQSWEAAQKDRQIGEKIGATGRACWGQWAGGYALWGMGNLRQAVAEIEQALDNAITIGEDRLATLCQSMLAKVYAEMGNATAANDFLTRALNATQGKFELFQQAYAHHVKGYVQLQQENWHQAADEFTLTRELMKNTEARDIDLFSLAYLAEALLELGEIEQAIAVLGESLELSQEVGAPYYEAITLRVQGRLLAKQGEFEAAATAFEGAHKLADETGSRLELGRILYQRALMYQIQGEEERARQDAGQAQSIFEECLAARDLGKAADLLEELG